MHGHELYNIITVTYRILCIIPVHKNYYTNCMDCMHVHAIA